MLPSIRAPAIPQGRTWSKLGEHGDGEHREYGNGGKHQPDGLKHSFFVTKNALVVNQMKQNTILQHLW